MIRWRAMPTFPPQTLLRSRRTPMFDLITGSSADCTGVSRRSFLRVGALSALGLTLPQFLRLRAEQPVAGRRDVKCILLWMQGGPSHIDTFDPKPDAPVEIRGE